MHIILYVWDEPKCKFYRVFRFTLILRGAPSLYAQAPELVCLTCVWACNLETDASGSEMVPLKGF